MEQKYEDEQDPQNLYFPQPTLEGYCQVRLSNPTEEDGGSLGSQIRG